MIGILCDSCRKQADTPNIHDPNWFEIRGLEGGVQMHACSMGCAQKLMQHHIDQHTFRQTRQGVWAMTNRPIDKPVGDW